MPTLSQHAPYVSIILQQYLLLFEADDTSEGLELAGKEIVTASLEHTPCRRRGGMTPALRVLLVASRTADAMCAPATCGKEHTIFCFKRRRQQKTQPVRAQKFSL